MRRSLEYLSSLSMQWHDMVWYRVYYDLYDHEELSENDSWQVFCNAQHVAIALATLGWCLRDAAYCAAIEARGRVRGRTDERLYGK